MLKLALVALSLCAAPLAFADNLPPNFDVAGWNQLTKAAIDKGDREQTEMGETRSLSRILPADKTQSHQADYFTASGATDSGSFSAAQFSMVSENWQKTKEGNWDIDQYLFLAFPNGDLRLARHNHIVETALSEILTYDPLPMGSPSDAATLSAWGERLKQWQGWISHP